MDAVSVSLRARPRTPKSILIGLVGNVLDHYDTALYSFLAPFIAPLMFPESSFIAALIKTYGLMSTSIVTRPLGAWFFGRFGSRSGARASLSLSLAGLAAVTLAMGILPVYNDIGEVAPLMLALLRLLQGFFGAGESTIAPFFVLNYSPQEKRGFFDSIYGSTVVLGEILASLAAMLVSLSSAPEFFWRLPFLLSGLTAAVSVYLRMSQNDEELLPEGNYRSTLWADLKRYRRNFLRVIAVSGMSYITYAIPFVFFNNFIPQITSITFEQMMILNTAFLAFDMVLLPIFGALADLVSHARFMFLMALLLFLSSGPLFYFLDNASMPYVSFVRIFIVLLGLGFCAPLHAWFMTQFESKERYILTGLAYAIGSQAFGRTTPAICLYLWHETELTFAPAFFIMLVSGLACIALHDGNKNTQAL